MAAPKTYTGTDPETGAKYEIGFTPNTGAYDILDIDVPAGVKCVKLSVSALKIDGLEGLAGPTERVHMPDSTKTFPDVEELLVDEGISSIHIPNSLFPNVRHVLSKTWKFADGVPFLAGIYKSATLKGDTWNLLNAFVLKGGEQFSLSSITNIAPEAFAGCGAADIVDTQGVESCTADAFSEEILEKYKEDEDGSSIVGTILARACPESETLRVPPGITCVAEGAFAGSKATRAELTNSNYHAFARAMHNMPDGIKELYVDVQEEWQLRQILSLIKGPEYSVESIEVTEDSALCKSMNGILYSKDGKKLLGCPAWKLGTVEVPEGVEEIEPYAFDGPCADSVTLPQTLRKIGEGAFLQSGLEEIDIPASVEEIGKMALMTIAKINIPGGKPIKGLTHAAATTNADAWGRSTDESAEYCYTSLWAEVKIGDEVFALPRFIRYANAHDFLESWENGVFDKELAWGLFEASTTNTGMQATAVAEMKLHPDNKAARAYLEKTADVVIDRYIRWNRIKELAEFLRLNFANRDQLAKSVDSAIKNKNETAKAYLLAALEYTEISTAKTLAL